MDGLYNAKSNEEERRRVEEAHPGGQVAISGEDYRLLGMIAVTRGEYTTSASLTMILALGDGMFKLPSIYTAKVWTRLDPLMRTAARLARLSVLIVTVSTAYSSLLPAMSIKLTSQLATVHGHPRYSTLSDIQLSRGCPHRHNRWPGESGVSHERFTPCRRVDVGREPCEAARQSHYRPEKPRSRSTPLDLGVRAKSADFAHLLSSRSTTKKITIRMM